MQIKDGFMGLVSKLDPSLVPPHFSVDCSNVQTVNGAIEKRPGLSLLHSMPDRVDYVDGFEDKWRLPTKWKEIGYAASGVHTANLGFPISDYYYYPVLKELPIIDADSDDEDKLGGLLIGGYIRPNFGELTNSQGFIRWNSHYDDLGWDDFSETEKPWFDSVNRGQVTAIDVDSKGNIYVAAKRYDTVSLYFAKYSIDTKKWEALGDAITLAHASHFCADLWFDEGRNCIVYCISHALTANTTNFYYRPIGSTASTKMGTDHANWNLSYTRLYRASNGIYYANKAVHTDTSTALCLLKWNWADSKWEYADSDSGGDAPSDDIFDMRDDGTYLYVCGFFPDNVDEDKAFGNTLRMELASGDIEEWGETGFTDNVYQIWCASDGEIYILNGTDKSAMVWDNGTSSWDVLDTVTVTSYDWNYFTQGIAEYGGEIYATGNWDYNSNAVNSTGRSLETLVVLKPYEKMPISIGGALVNQWKWGNDAYEDVVNAMVFDNYLEAANQFIEFDFRFWTKSTLALEFNIDFRASSQTRYDNYNAYRLNVTCDATTFNNLTLQLQEVSSGTPANIGTASVLTLEEGVWKGNNPNTWYRIRITIQNVSGDPVINVYFWDKSGDPDNTVQTTYTDETGPQALLYHYLVLIIPTGNENYSLWFKNFVWGTLSTAARVDQMWNVVLDDGTETFLILNNGAIQKWNSDFSKWLTIGVLEGDEIPTAAMALNKLYLTAGGERLKKTDGTDVFSVGLDQPNTPSAATGAGSGFTGTWSYKISYYDSVNLIESLPSDAEEITITDDAKITLTFKYPTDGFADKIRIYRADISGGEENWYWLKDIDIPKFSTHTNWGTWDDSYLDEDTTKTITPQDYATRPTEIKTLAWFASRMYMAEAEGSELRYSEASVPDYVPSLNSIYVGRGDGDSITGLIRFFDWLVIGKENTLWLCDSSFNVSRIDDLAGCASQASMQIINQTLYYAGKHGIFSFNGQVTTYLSQCIENLWQALSRARDPYMIAGIDPDSGLYMISVSAGGTEQDKLYCLNTRAQGEMIGKVFATNIVPWNLALTAFSFPYVANAAGVHELTGNNDNSVGITWNWKSGNFDFGAYLTEKRYTCLMVGKKKQGTSKSCTFGYYLDDGSLDSATLDESVYDPGKMNIKGRGYHLFVEIKKTSSTDPHLITSIGLNAQGVNYE